MNLKGREKKETSGKGTGKKYLDLFFGLAPLYLIFILSAILYEVPELTQL